MRHKKKLSLLILLLLPLLGKAVGWPANFKGVMLQGFYWDSYQTETKWYLLEQRADELSASFRLIWLPYSGKSTGGLGYMPIYWFTNHNSDMGSEAQLTSMIAAYRERGTGILTDLVINHRAGRTNWSDFPSETWNGVTYHIGLDGICCNDEINNSGNPGGATGAYDEGENFDGARDLDHTNANVQLNCKNFCKCLLEKYGYEGYRVDMAKGYAGYYLKMYNQYAKPSFSVGEYWDGSYDALAAWIESTGWESAAFDFAFKYAVNDAFASGDLTKLVWLENGVTPKPAGLIHHWYQQMAVTFIDNHDTYRDDWNKFSGNVLAANAFMICSPGTPCVFLPHWNEYGPQIAKMIEARNAMGITNTSDVRVLKYSTNCYMAEMTGTEGSLVVKVGSDWVSPEGYTDSQIHCSGDDYCIWTSKPVDGSSGGSDSYPASLYIMGNLSIGNWTTDTAIKMSKDGSVYTAKDVEFVATTGETDAFFTLTTTTGSNWDAVNASDRYGAPSKDKALPIGTTGSVTKYPASSNASSACSWAITPGTYDVTVDLSTMTIVVSEPGQAVDMPDRLYLIGNLASGSWTTNSGIEFTKTETGFYLKNASLVEASTGSNAYFSFATKLSSTSGDWTTVNSSDRFGAKSKDLAVTPGIAVDLVRFEAGTSASSANAWSIAPGTYDIVVDFATYKVTVTNASASVITIPGCEDIDIDAEYYNMFGQQVPYPTPGNIYIVRKGQHTYKRMF